MIKQFNPWVKLANNGVDKKDLSTRLKNYYTMSGTLSGLTSGFTYLVSTSNLEFKVADTVINGVTLPRINIWAGLVLTSFLFSLGSTLLSSMILGFANLVGVNNSYWFVSKFYLFLDLPIVLLIGSLIVMLASGLIAVGGLYESPSMFYYALGLGIVVGLFSFIFFIVLGCCSLYRIVKVGSTVNPESDEESKSL